MRFLREHLFFVVLLAATVVLAAGGLVYYMLSDVDVLLKQRRTASAELEKLSGRRVKISEKTVDGFQKFTSLVHAAVAKASEDSITFNRQELPILQLPISPSQFEPALPFDRDRYDKGGLYLIFIQEYTKTMDQMISPDRADLGRTHAPTREELAAEEARLREQFKERAGLMAVSSMRLRKAEAGRIYIEDGAMDRVFTGERTAPPQALWEAQVNLWVTRQLLQAIIATNRELEEERKADGFPSAKPSVLTSAVKRLVRVEIREDFAGLAKGAMSGGRTPGLTERSTTGEYGVIEYNFTVIIPPHDLPRLMRNLMLQNYHTVVRVATVEVLREKSEFYYGTEPVFQAELSAEMLLLLDGKLRQSMPDEVRSRLPSGRPAPD